MLEMLADSSLNAVKSGPALNAPPRMVGWLTEVCDPVQAITYPFDGSEGSTRVCNFVTPAYYSGAVPGAVYDRCRALDGPWQIAPGGYTTYEENGYWYQVRRDMLGNWAGPFQGPAVPAGPPPASSREIITQFFQTWELRRNLLDPAKQEEQEHYHASVIARASDRAARLRMMFPVLQGAQDTAQTNAATRQRNAGRGA
jgi:hypothetical protein